MEIKLNKGISITLTIVLLITYLFGLILISLTYNILYPDNVYDFSYLELIISNLELTFRNLHRIIIGLWFFINADKFKQDKWTWLLIGLSFGQYGLILFGIMMIIQNISSQVDLFKSLKPILILLILTLPLSSLAKFIIGPYLTTKLDIVSSSFITLNSSYLAIVTMVVVIILNIIFAYKLNTWIKQQKMNNKRIWTIATIFLGLFPIILFNELTIIHKHNNNAA